MGLLLLHSEAKFIYFVRKELKKQNVNLKKKFILYPLNHPKGIDLSLFRMTHNRNFFDFIPDFTATVD